MMWLHLFFAWATLMRLNSGAHTWIKPRWVAPAASLAAPTVALPLALRQPLRHSTNELLQKTARLAFLGHRKAVQDLRHALLELRNGLHQVLV